MSLKQRWELFEQSPSAYRAVTGIVLLLILVPIAIPADSAWSPVTTALLSGSAATLALAASGAKPWVVRIALLAWIAAVVAAVVPGTSSPLPAIAGAALSATLIAAPVMILRRVWHHETVTATTLWGAIAAYLSIGIAFSLAYAVIADADASAFTNLVSGGFGEFNYFSFVTLTTLGYGDITPVSDLARSVIVFETVIGQGFLVVVLSRVVSLLGSGERLGRKRG